jgi:hypothetical protein
MHWWLRRRGEQGPRDGDETKKRAAQQVSSSFR